MTFATIFRALPLRVWLTLIALIVFLILVMAYCSSRDAVRDLKDEATVADARTKTAQETIDRIAENQFINDGLRQEAREAQDAIRQADPADRDRVARCELRKLQGDASPC